MSKDHEYIKELFDSDGIRAPESLSEESMLAMLESAEQSEEKPSEKKEEKRFSSARPKSRASLKRWAAMTAVAFVAFFGITGLRNILTSPPDTSAINGELYTFKSESEIQRLLESLDSSAGFGRYGLGGGSFTDDLIEYETEAIEDSAADTGTTGTAAAKSAENGGHSETYLQVDDVDEADIVKTDGKYIYYVTGRREVIILSAEDGKTEKLSVIGNGRTENYISDIYIKGDRLITVGTIFKDDSDDGCSGIVVYDISDRSKPEELYDFSQTGNILSSRMVGNCLYLVTNDYVFRGGRAVPLCGSINAPEKLEATDICCVPEPRSSSYIVLSAVDIASGDQGRTVTKAILGASEQIYCNDHNLYCTSMEWTDDGTYYTRIVRASLDGLNVKVDATTSVRGYVDSQFSMDERGGYFRIATTSQRAGINVNNLYVLDSKLKETGKVTGFARNESIKAVRYVGDKAYVITYEAIDPLFIIDLSDPSAPRIEGEVKIDGFSTLLIPISADRLLGIGYATGDNGYGGEFASGLKLALFDISDPSEPKVLDSKEFENMSSIAQYDHHALMVNNDEGYYAIPYEVWNYSSGGSDVFIEDEDAAVDIEEPAEETYETGVLLFRAGDKLGPSDKHTLDGKAIFRSVYIGDWIYALDSEGNVQSFKPAL